ncbi:chromate transporter [Halochromatium roseum]|uniref:chromate transporter n=1 Tax=Halochromatium roseum TaxID=391920 RepID=UPI0019143AAD|nr:chromate transporter [Halochromatium roseum]MBK5940987.1 hypothetical protein [Halochromatium roseum]
MTVKQTLATVESGRPGEVFVAFLKLGLISFGGPIAHLGYFRDELVLRRRWLSEASYADLVALCQFLPGPASSQVGFALGYLRGGLRGALLAWAAFTLPSALLLLAFALGAEAVGGELGQDLLRGLKLVAGANAAVVGILGAALYQPLWTSFIGGDKHQIQLGRDLQRLHPHQGNQRPRIDHDPLIHVGRSRSPDPHRLDAYC